LTVPGSLCIILSDLNAFNWAGESLQEECGFCGRYRSRLGYTDAGAQPSMPTTEVDVVLPAAQTYVS
jgi:hypothetical protein